MSQSSQRQSMQPIFTNGETCTLWAGWLHERALVLTASGALVNDQAPHPIDDKIPVASHYTPEY